MATIHSFATRFNAAASAWNEIKQQALIETALETVPEMTESQLRLGELSTGDLLHPDLASTPYALRKQESGSHAPYGIPDLLQSGNFYSKIRTTIGPKTINTYSLDIKAPALELKYTRYIYGYNDANRQKYAIEFLKPVLFQKLKTAAVFG